MGCTSTKQPLLPKRAPESKSSFHSHDATEDTIVLHLLAKSAFFTGISHEDLAEIASLGTLVPESSARPIKLIAGQQFLLGGCVLVNTETNEAIAKRKDIYGEDCFVPNAPPSAGLFSFKRARRESASRDKREAYSRDWSREMKDHSSQDSPSKLNFPRSSSRERAPSREDLSAAADSVSNEDIGLKLKRLEGRQMAMFEKKDVDALAMVRDSLREGLQVLLNRARFRSASGFYRSGCLSFLRPHELKMFALGFDYCSLQNIEKHSATASSNFYYICDGVLEIVVNAGGSAFSSPNTVGSVQGEESPFKTAGKLGSGSFISETTGLLQAQKRFANKLSYRVVEPGVALYLSEVALHNYFETMFSDQAKRGFRDLSNDRQTKRVRSMFPCFMYLSDEMLELLMESCSSTTLVAGEEVPRPQDFHLVCKGSITTSGSIRRRSIGGGLIVLVPQPVTVTSTTYLTGIPRKSASASPCTTPTANSMPSVVGKAPSSPTESNTNANTFVTASGTTFNIVSAGKTMVQEGDFFSNQAVVKLFNNRSASSSSQGESTVYRSNSSELSSFASESTQSGLPETGAGTAIQESTIWTFPLELVSLVMSKEPLWAVDLEIRALKENASIEAILAHPVGAYYFRMNLESAHAEENIDFYLAAKSFAGGIIPAAYASLVTASSSFTPINNLVQMTPPGFTRSFSGRLRMREHTNSPGLLSWGPATPAVASSNSGASGGAALSPPEMALDPSAGTPTADPGAFSSASLPPQHIPSPLDLFAVQLFNEFIDEGANRQINIASEMRSQLKRAVMDTNGPVLRDAFVMAQQECLKIMVTDSYPRFRTCKLFDDMIRDICNGLTLKEVMLQMNELPLSGFGHRKSASSGGLTSPIAAAKKRLSVARTSPSKTKPDSAARLNMDEWVFRRDHSASSFDSASVSPRAVGTFMPPRMRTDSRDSADSSSFARFGRKREASSSVERQATPNRAGSVPVGMSPNDFKRKQEESAVGTMSPTEAKRKHGDSVLGTINESPTSISARPFVTAADELQTLPQLPATAPESNANVSSPGGIDSVRLQSVSISSSIAATVVPSSREASSSSSAVMHALQGMKPSDILDNLG